MAGTHILGAHADLAIATGQDTHPETTTPEQARHRLDAILQCLDLTGGTAQASRPQASAPAKPLIANRTRSHQHQPAPMNPVHRHYGAGEPGKPPGDTDSAYWLNQYQRVHTHYDRCEVVRRAATYLASLITRDPNAKPGDFTDKEIRQQALTEGRGHPLNLVAQRFRQTTRQIAAWRTSADLHPLTGTPWTPPQLSAFAAHAAREMRDAGMCSTDIAKALGCSASAVRMWTTQARRAA